MTYAILLDEYQEQVDPDQYAVTFSGTLEDCRAQTNHDGRFESWLKADFVEGTSEPTRLENPEGGMDSGRIVELEEVASPLWAGITKLAVPIAAVGAGIAGVIAIARRRKPRGRGRRGRR